MIRLVITYIWAFIFLVLLQVLILNNMHLSIYINAYAYILFILILPFESPGWLNLSLAFAIGLTMDAFSNSLGMHSAAMVLLAFSRHYLLKVMAPRDGYEGNQTPHYGNMGVVWFLIYAGILTLIHHLTLFTIEDFHFTNLFSVLFKAILSSIFTVVIMMGILLISYKPIR